MQNPFTEAMSERSDKELVDIVTLKREEYQPEALLAAEAELLKRNLDVNDYYTQEMIDELKANASIAPEQLPLTILHKVAIVLAPALITFLVSRFFSSLGQTALTKFLPLPFTIVVMFGVHYNLKENGYLQRAKEFALWCNYTIAIYIGLAILTAIDVLFL